MIYRCALCNKVNSMEVISDPEEFMSGPKGYRKFFPDPHRTGGVVCFQCKESIDDVLDNYHTSHPEDDESEDVRNDEFGYVED